MRSLKISNDTTSDVTTSTLSSPSEKLPACVDFDDRPLVCDLLVAHSPAIKSVREIIQTHELFEANKSRYDDIWILRFVLTHNKNVIAASKAAIKTMEFREKKKLNELGDIRHRVPRKDDDSTSNIFQCHKKFYKYCETKDTAMNTLPDKNRGIVQYCLLDKVDIIKISHEMSEEEIQDVYVYLNEAIHQIQDDVTRRTGRLTKKLQILDIKDFHFRNLSMTFVKNDALANKAIEEYYPQLLGKVLIVNSPVWVSRTWNLIRPLFPRRYAEKVSILPPLTKMKSKDMKYFTRYISEQNLPERYGGKNKEWPPVCAGKSFLI